MKRLLFLASLLFFTRADAVSPTDPGSGNYWTSVCNSKIPEKFECYSYVTGFIRGVQLQSIVSQKPPLFCLPAGTSYTQVADVYAKFLNDNPAKRHMDAAELAYIALTANFPCK